MKKIILIILICSFCNVKADNLKKYYKYINKAELSICESKYDKAIKYYKKAFVEKEHPFDKDYYNAFLCAFYLNDTILKQNYIYKLIQREFDFKKFVKGLDSNQRKYFYTYYNIYDKIKPLTNKNYSDVLDSLYSRDQLVRHFSLKDDNIYRRKLIDRIDSINLLELIRTYNYCGMLGPGFTKMGSDNGYIIIWHSLNRADTIPKIACNFLYNIYKKEVLNGNYNNLKYALLCDRAEDIASQTKKIISKESYKMYAIQFDDTLFLPKFENEKEINKLRKNIFLEPISDTRKKIFIISKILKVDLHLTQ